MDYERLEHSGFDSGPTGRGAFAGRGARTAYALRTAAYNHVQRTKRKRNAAPARSMIIKLGVCAAACAAVVLVRALQPEELLSVSAPKAEENVQDDTSQLGRLQFVELPGILEVFSGGKGATLPVACESMEELEEGLLLKLETGPGKTAKAGEACTVKAVGEDAVLGKSVSVTTREDRELIYYGFESVSVEEGQGLVAGDDLGPVAGPLYIRLNVEGRPTGVAEYFNLVDAGK